MRKAIDRQTIHIENENEMMDIQIIIYNVIVKDYGYESTSPDKVQMDLGYQYERKSLDEGRRKCQTGGLTAHLVTRPSLVLRVEQADCTATKELAYLNDLREVAERLSVLISETMPITSPALYEGFYVQLCSMFNVGGDLCPTK